MQPPPIHLPPPKNCNKPAPASQDNDAMEDHEDAPPSNHHPEVVEVAVDEDRSKPAHSSDQALFKPIAPPVPVMPGQAQSQASGTADRGDRARQTFEEQLAQVTEKLDPQPYYFPRAA
jgi:hypothetical protein